MAQANLLLNGTLELPFYDFRNQADRRVVVGWAPWWEPAATGAPEWQNQAPTFGPANPGGEAVQMISSPWATHTGGLLQQVPSAPGNRFELSVDALAWSSESEEPGSKKQPSDVNVQIGLDPTGGLDPTSPLVVWSAVQEPLGRWQPIRLEAESEAPIITVYLKSAPTLPKRQQAVYWRNAFLRGVGRYRRSTSIVGVGDTHITLTPSTPRPGDEMTAVVSANSNHPFVELTVERPDGAQSTVIFKGLVQQEERFVWRYTFRVHEHGLFDTRFVADRGAQLLAQRLVQVSQQTQVVPSGLPRLDYRRVYILLPPTADATWLAAAARGGFERRFTVGFSADDAGVGDLGARHVLAVNPHHWPEVLTAEWFEHYYPGTIFTAVVANKPADLEAWLQMWEPET